MTKRKDFGRWIRGEQIGGHAGQCSVNLATDSTNDFGGPFVLKSPKNKKRYDRFRNEVKARLDLAHPNIVRIVDHALETDPPYFVEEYCPSGSLADNLSEFKGSLLNALGLFLQMCEGVLAAHQHNPPIIHRDIKPANILYNKVTKIVQLTDFGLCYCEDEDRATKLGEQVGSRFFICPEMEQGASITPTPACDIYSLGKVLYWMIDGSFFAREIHREDAQDLRQRFQDEQMERVNWLLDRMICYNPLDRFSSVETVCREVEAMIPLVRDQRNVIATGVDQKCSYCGIGWFIHAAKFDPVEHQKHPNDSHFRDAVAVFSRYGVEIQRDNFFRLLLQCKYCGRVELFIRDAAQNPWDRKVKPLKSSLRKH